MTAYLHDFHEAGYYVMPLWPILVDGSCGCGKPACNWAGKHPRMLQWNALPRFTEDELEVMEGKGGFSTGYGVRMAGQLLVVDVDARNGGLESMDKLKQYYPDVHASILASGFQVATGSGGGSMHYYFAVPRKLERMRQALEGYVGIDFKTNGYVVGAGSLHKSGNTYEVEVGRVEKITHASEALIGLLEVKATQVEWVDEIMGTMDATTLRSLVEALPNNQASREEWVQVGMALHHETAGQGVELWQMWSAKYPDKHDGHDCFQKWKSFGRQTNRPVTIGTLILKAKEAGWEPPTPPLLWKRECDWAKIRAEEVQEVGQFVNLPVDVKAIDLTRPPDLAGMLCEWINKTSIRKREHLAVASALMILSIAGGLSHASDSGVHGNLMFFGVAESGSGKNHQEDCVKNVLIELGLAHATYGNIKSEQELVLNALEHQLAYYLMDEIGEFMKKLANAQKAGGASYLQNVVGTIMSMYSKAGSTFGISGDLYRGVMKEMATRLKALQAGNGGDSDGIRKSQSHERQIQALELRIAELKGQAGIKKPYLCVFGFSTPELLETIVNDDNVRKGFLGRAIIFEEDDNAPPKNKEVVREPLNPWAMAKLQVMAKPLTNDGLGRIGFVGEDKPVIHTEQDAKDFLEELSDFFDELAKDFEMTNNLTPLANRAYEQVEKVSFVLALGKGRRTLEHVNFAFALVMRDIELKTRWVVGNRAGEDVDIALKEKVLAVLKKREIPESTLRQKLGTLGKKANTLKLTAVLKNLEKQGEITLEKRVAPKQKKETLYIKKL